MIPKHLLKAGIRVRHLNYEFKNSWGKGTFYLIDGPIDWVGYIEFDKPSLGQHDCNGLCPKNNGYYITGNEPWYEIIDEYEKDLWI